jgi:hypothetical protein
MQDTPTEGKVSFILNDVAPPKEEENAEWPETETGTETDTETTSRQPTASDPPTMKKPVQTPPAPTPPKGWKGRIQHFLVRAEQNAPWIFLGFVFGSCTWLVERFF